MLTMDDSYNKKEFLLYTLIETMIKATERLTFFKWNIQCQIQDIYKISLTHKNIMVAIHHYQIYISKY